MTNFQKNENSSRKAVNRTHQELKDEIENSFINQEKVTQNIQSHVELLPAVKNLKNKNNFFKKKLLKGYSKIHELKLVTIGLASPEKIKSWAEKELPNGKIFGEVTNANTFHYRTFKPSKGGLFCERIFGPIKDFECACGKRQRPTALESRKILEHEQTTRYFCPNCDVEYTWSIIRRYQLGYIKLNAPVTHLWYFKTNPSYLSILFDMKRKHLESIIYCTETITVENMLKTAEQNSKFHPSPTELYKNWQTFFSLEEKIQKNYIMNEKKKKRKKQKKTFFRENFFQKEFVFLAQRKLNWSNFNKELLEKKIEKNSLFADSISGHYFQSLSDKKTNIFLNVQKQKQNQLFSHLFQKIWKMVLQKTYKNAFAQIQFQQIFAPNCKNISQLFYLNSWCCFSKKLLNSSQKNFGKKSEGISFIFSNSSFFCTAIGQNKFKTKKSKMIFFPQNLSSNYLETLSKKNTNYQNFQNCSIFLKLKPSTEILATSVFHESIKKKTKFSVLRHSDPQKESLAYTKAENFWNSFYFLFESGSFFVSFKMKKTNFKSLSKKELLFLLNIIPLFQKIFFYKHTKFVWNKNSSRIQTFLLKMFFVSKNKTANWNIEKLFYDGDEKSESFSKNTISKISNKNFSYFIAERKQSLKKIQTFPFFFENKKRSMLQESQNIFAEEHIIPIDLLKIQSIRNSLKNTKSIKFQTTEKIQKYVFSNEFHTAALAPAKAGAWARQTILNFEKILWYFKQYYEIEFCLSFFLLNPLLSFPLFKETKNGVSSNFLFESISQQIDLSELLNFLKRATLNKNHSAEQTFSTLSFAHFQKKSSFELRNIRFFKNIEDLQKEKNQKLSQDSEKTFEKQNSLNKKFNKFYEKFFEHSRVCSVIEKLGSEYFSFFLVLMDSGFLFSPKNFVAEHNNKYENSDLTSFLFFHLFKMSLKQKKSKEKTNFVHPMILKFSQSYQFSFLFFSFHIFQNIIENQTILKKRKHKSFKQNSISHYSQNIFKLGETLRKLEIAKSNADSQRSKERHTEFFVLPLPLRACAKRSSAEGHGQGHERKTRKIRISNDSFVFPLFFEKKQSVLTNRKKFFQKNQQLQKTKFLPWLSQEQILESKNKKMDPFLSSGITASGKNHLVFNNQKSFQNLQEKSMFNFSLFFQNKQKSQLVPYPSCPSGTGQENQNFFKNPVYTVSYNAVWPNDSDWKYFIYYNAFFMHEFEDKPIFEYVSVSRTTRVHQNSFFETLEDSFASFLSHQIDSFQNNFFVGAGILEKFLIEYTSLELRKMTKQHQILLPKINQKIRFLKQLEKTKKDSLKIQKYFQKREHIIRRLKFLRKFFRRNSNPSFMILRNIPVLPPDLRPILKLQNQIAASDLNRFYQRIIYRNDRLKKFSKDSATNQSFEMKYAQRLLQEAVDNLIQNGKGGGKAETNSRGQALKSLSEILKGKQGRFRQYLLGKRVDYSGRSVIVVGPQLKLYECGLPKEMALELFLPFLIQYILQSKLAQTVIGAKNLLKNNSTFTFHLLNKVIKNIPVLLNRAPTLHRLGFQAFLPKLIEGRAILLHPMVCPAFNADFDGDQMAVHIPLTVEARTEAWKFMLATNNLMNSATGEPILLPSQDMVLGCYFLTLDYYAKSFAVQLSNTLKKQYSSPPQPNKQTFPNPSHTNMQKSHLQNFQYFIRQQKSFLLYNNFHEILAAYQRKEISLHTPVWVKWTASVNFGNDSSKPVEIRLQQNGCWEVIRPKYTTFFDQKNQKLSQYIRTTTGRILMNFMIHECVESDR